MTDLSSLLPSFFFASKANPQGNNELRQRLAMAMLSQKRAAPKTFGEGLAAIGDAIGDRGQMQQMMDFDKAQRDYAAGLTGNPPPGSPAAAPPVAPSPATSPARMSYAPTDATPDAPPAGGVATATGAVGSTEPAPPPVPPLANTPGSAQPASMLSPNVGAGGMSPAASPRDQVAAAMMRPPGGPPRPPGGVQTNPNEMNLLDARAIYGFKRPGAGRVQDAVERAYPNSPGMQAYASSLVSGEQSGPGDTSSTGARGPYQFVPGTARQYGLKNPDDVDASTDAFKRFTADNAATLERRLGRPPTYADLALAHQQGAKTAASMLAGTGNAPPRNLALNNVNPGAGPAQATAQIKRYYGMPEVPAGAPPQAPPPAPTAPVMAFSGEPTPANAPGLLSFTPPQAQQGPQIPPAPPPQQTAQAGQQPPPGYYVTPQQAPPTAPPPSPQSAREQELTRLIAAGQGNPYIAQSPAAQELARLQQARTLQDEQAKKQYETELQIYRDRAGKREDQLSGLPKTITDVESGREDVARKREDARLRSEYGGLPQEAVIKKLGDSQTKAESAAKGLQGAYEARKALMAGAITGAGADQRLNLEKFLANMGWRASNDEIANTEVFKAQMAPLVASILHQTAGTTQLSEGDRRFAEKAAAGDINLDGRSIRRLIDIIGQGSVATIERHNSDVGVFYPDGSKGRALFNVEVPKEVQQQIKDQALLSPAERKQIDGAENWLVNNPNHPDAPEIRRRLGYKR